MQSAEDLSLHELAAENNLEQLTSKLSSLRVSIDKRDDFYKTPLHIAAKSNKGKSHLKIAEILLTNGADPNARDSNGYTPLWYLARNGNVEILNLFSRFKADFTWLDYRGSSLLRPAVKNDHYSLEVVKFLVEDICLDVNHKDYNGMSPLHYAIEINKSDSHYEVLKYLLEMGSEVNAQNSKGETPIFNVIRRGNSRVFDLFMSHKADFGVVENVLFEFVNNNSDVEFLDKLLNSKDLGLNVNQRDADGLTPLHHAVQQCFRFSKTMNTDVIKCLLKNGADINAFDNKGVTPLVIALPGFRRFKMKYKEKGPYFVAFLIEQTDFSLDLKNLYEDYFGRRSIVRHLAKFKFLSIPIHPSLQKIIQDQTFYRNYFDQCTKELEVMINTKPQNSWITFFNLLVDNRRKLKNYAGNENLIEDYKNNDWSEKFPIYGDSLKRNVEKGLRRRELFDKSSILLCDCVPIFNPNHLITKDILDCVLSKKVLSKFLCEK